jgi:hypothetical protein
VVYFRASAETMIRVTKINTYHHHHLLIIAPVTGVPESVESPVTVREPFSDVGDLRDSSVALTLPVKAPQA